MKKITILIISIFVVLMLTMTAHAQQDFRCGSYIVKTGDSKMDVLMKCGEPAMREEAGADTSGRYGASTSYRGNQSYTQGAYQESTSRVELWYYNCGEGQFNRILEFLAGTLVAIYTSDQRGVGPADWERKR
jgi:hypothetical protein